LVVGNYTDASGVGHGFVYNRGRFTNLDYPGAAPPLGTFLAGVNNSGAIVGQYSGTEGGAFGLSHGFLYRKGTFTEVAAPDAGTNTAGLCTGFDYFTQEGTVATGISAGGVIVGAVCNDVGAPNSQYGWVLSHGKFSSLNDPNAGPGGTFPWGVSQNGRFVTGNYFDTGGVEHGFVATLTP
jgi:hypothetical protein